MNFSSIVTALVLAQQPQTRNPAKHPTDPPSLIAMLSGSVHQQKYALSELARQSKALSRKLSYPKGSIEHLEGTRDSEVFFSSVIPQCEQKLATRHWSNPCAQIFVRLAHTDSVPHLKQALSDGQRAKLSMFQRWTLGRALKHLLRIDGKKELAQ